MTPAADRLPTQEEMATVDAAQRTWLEACCGKVNVLGNCGTQRFLTLHLVDELYLEAERNGRGGFPVRLVSGIVQIQNYLTLLRGERCYEPGPLAVHGDGLGIQYDGLGGSCPWAYEPDCPENEIWAIGAADYEAFSANPGAWFAAAQPAGPGELGACASTVLRDLHTQAPWVEPPSPVALAIAALTDEVRALRAVVERAVAR